MAKTLKVTFDSGDYLDFSNVKNHKINDELLVIEHNHNGKLYDTTIIKFKDVKMMTLANVDLK